MYLIPLLQEIFFNQNSVKIFFFKYQKIFL